MIKQQMSKKLPLVVILGSTGSGKTKLSLELAQKFGGEIIGADSMQIYKCLDIITAKATKSEQAIATHHMIDILEPDEKFTVTEYRNRALEVIDRLQNENKLPIIVGGTNYYIESLLWKILVDTNQVHTEKNQKLLDTYTTDLSSEQLHDKLKEIDPDMAKRLHPQNKRKILRSLEVWLQTGRKLSEILKEQQTSDGGSKTGGGLRFDNSIIFWMQCEQGVLDERLNARVDTMLEQGLVKELLHFHDVFNKQRINKEMPTDYTKGVFQSIGFKEFHSYLMLSDDERNNNEGVKKLEKGIEQLKLVTRRYARKQKKWCMNRFLGRTDREVPPLYALDTTDVSAWSENVTNRAFAIVDSYFQHTQCPFEPLPFISSSNSVPNSEDDTFVCVTCERTFIGRKQWGEHQKSNNHRRKLESLRKKRKIENEEGDVDMKKPKKNAI